MSDEYMSEEYTDPFIMSDLPNVGAVPLDVEVNVDDIAFMRRIGLDGGKPGIAVSAFNSSI